MELDHAMESDRGEAKEMEENKAGEGVSLKELKEEKEAEEAEKDAKDPAAGSEIGENGEKNGKDDAADMEVESDDDDGIHLILRDVREMEKHLEDGGEAFLKGLEKDGDGEEGAEKDVEEEEQKFKYSHGKSKKYPKLPGRAGEITETNYSQYAGEIGKRNTPFEVDLDKMQEKPWTRFNSSLDDYFNFGFNEQTWREYAARQVALRIHNIDSEKGHVDELE